MQFGEHIKHLREKMELLQRQLAAALEIDTPMYSKIERGERKAKREQVEKLAEILEADKKKFLTLWLADQIVNLLEDEPLALDAMKIADKKLKKSEKK